MDVTISGWYYLTEHAKERTRQRIGLTSEDSASAWVNSEIERSIRTEYNGNKTHYFTDTFEIVCDGAKVVTIKPNKNVTSYVTKLGGVLAKETSKLLNYYGKELRKADVTIAEHQLNFLRAKNPKTKTLINERLTDAIDWKSAIEDEIYAVKKAAKQYGIDEV